MKINSEWKLLEAIKSKIENEGLKTSPDLAVSIGDDCAVFEIDDSTYGLLTTDISIENVHFKLGMIPLEDIGWKAMTGNISDIAAMGGVPLYAVVSLAIPGAFTEDDVLSLYEGMLQAANPAGISIAGGDISKSGGLVINIALYGRVPKSRLVKRKGAAADDIIYVTGTLGDSMAGLEILLSCDSGLMKKFPGLVAKHKRPPVRFNILNDIMNVFSPTAMIDISDGLLSDLRHICEAGSAGFRLIEKNLPVSGELISYAEMKGENHFNYALTSGEEYELLFTSSKKLADLMKLTINGIPVLPIGEIIDSGFLIQRGGKIEEIEIDGFNHFKEGKP
ncbi:MAG: thiamine-phosphate kinase [Spirochaetes bacterium]|jgi:thiamine-monophosphate kinase|nr:thiamine-phosphate kinase [Spirochaetota bacterium]